MMSPVRQSCPSVEEDAEREALADVSMEWATPQFGRGQVDWSGRALVRTMRDELWGEGDRQDYYKALDIINNWRSAHAYPLNILQDGLRKKARKIDTNAVVA